MVFVDNSGETTDRTYCPKCGSGLLYHIFDKQIIRERLSDNKIRVKKFIVCPNCHTEVVLDDGEVEFKKNIEYDAI